MLPGHPSQQEIPGVLRGNAAHFALSCRMLPRDCQMLLFSATFEDSVWKFAQKVVPDPNIIKLKREEETLDTIKQYYVLCNSRDEKFRALCNIYGAITIAQAMVFCHVSPSGESYFQQLRWPGVLFRMEPKEGMGKSYSSSDT